MKLDYYLGFLLLMVLFLSCKRYNNEVLEAFSDINSKLEESNQKQSLEQDSLIQLFINDTAVNGTFIIYRKKSQALDSLISSVKEKMVEDIGWSSNFNSKDDIDFQKMDRSSSDSLLFNNEKPSQIGLELINKMNDYRNTFVKLFLEDYPEITKNAEQKFNVNVNEKMDWLTYNFKGFPAVATLTKLTQIQSDLKFIEGKLIEAILTKQ